MYGSKTNSNCLTKLSVTKSARGVNMRAATCLTKHTSPTLLEGDACGLCAKIAGVEAQQVGF